MGRLTREDLDFIKNNVNQMTNAEMADVLKCNVSTISNWRKKMGISFTDLHDFSSYHDYITQNYNIKTSTSLSKEIGCSKAYIGKVWREAGLIGKDNRSYYSNFNYFESINSGNKAYLVGLFASDGCLYKREGHQGLIQLSLQKEDKLLLEDVVRELESNNPIKSQKDMLTLSITSQKMYDDLLKIGLEPKKTWTLNMELVLKSIPEKYLPDFFRGYFDGDGHVGIGTPSRTHVRFAMPEQTALLFQKELLRLYNIETKFYRDEREGHYSSSFGSLECCSISQKYLLLKVMYFLGQGSLALARKQERANIFINKIENNATNRSENKSAVTKWGELLENLK
jgi:intein-encoded DNA endonuclease-like protein